MFVVEFVLSSNVQIEGWSEDRLSHNIARCVYWSQSDDMSSAHLSAIITHEQKLWQEIYPLNASVFLNNVNIRSAKNEKQILGI